MISEIREIFYYYLLGINIEAKNEIIMSPLQCDNGFMNTSLQNQYEVLIIGGGPAGLSAALTLGRIERKALLCDDNRPRNAPSAHVNNFPTRDGIHPADWRKLARQDLQKYKTIESFEGSVQSVEKEGSGFRATLLSSGETKVSRHVFAKKLILAYGIQDQMPGIEGFRELWGRAIFHCPFCHGYEIRGERMGFIAKSELALHALGMVETLASSLTVFTNGTEPFTDETLSLFKKRDIKVVLDKIARLDYARTETDIKLKSLILENGKKYEIPYLFASPDLPFRLKSSIGESLGCAKTDLGLYQVDMKNETTVKGIFACGDNMSLAQSVLLASASGVLAGGGAIASLLADSH